MIVASGSGSQLGPYAGAAGTLILVAGAHKVVRDPEEGHVVAPPGGPTYS